MIINKLFTNYFLTQINKLKTSIQSNLLRRNKLRLYKKLH